MLTHPIFSFELTCRREALPPSRKSAWLSPPCASLIQTSFPDGVTSKEFKMIEEEAKENSSVDFSASKDVLRKVQS